MMKRTRRTIYLIALLLGLAPAWGWAQCTDWQAFEQETEVFSNPAFGLIITIEKDRSGAPYVYVAAKDDGLRVYDVSGASPALVTTIPVDSLGGIDVINLYQEGNYLYASLGDIWTSDEASGLAIFDVRNPVEPLVLDYYALPGSGGGAGAVKVQGDYAYLGAMQNGLLVLNISNKENIVMEGQVVLENNFPHQLQGKDDLYNARGIDVQGDIAYVCHDRGGLRVIDISDKKKPVQINQYCFADLIDHATAYNNVLIHGNLAYVGIDYYGLEILDISDPMNIRQLGWWHPEDWAPPTNNLFVWLNANGHANELALDTVCQRLYVSAGKSDVVALDVSDPTAPLDCEIFGTPDDRYGTWGLDYFDNQVCIAYIWAPITPPLSDFTGFRVLNTPTCTVTAVETLEAKTETLIFPNPFKDQLSLTFNRSYEHLQIQLYTMNGQLVQEHHFSQQQEVQIEVPNQAACYFLKVQKEDEVEIHKVLQQSN